MGSVVVTANLTRSGAVVYLTEGRRWSPALADAWVLPSEAASDEALAFAKGQEAEVTDPFVIDVTRDGGVLRTTSAREQIRAEGPATVLARLGYGEPR